MELKSKRGLNSRTIKKNGKICKQIFSNDIHYDNYLKIGDGKSGFRQINKKWTKSIKGFQINYAWDKIFAPENSTGIVTYYDTFFKRENKLKLQAVNARNSIGKIQYINCGLFAGEAVIYENAFGEAIDLIFMPTARDFLKIIKIKNQNNRKLKFKFKIDFDQDRKKLNFDEEKIITEKVTFCDILCHENDTLKSTILKQPIVWDNSSIMGIADARFFYKNGSLILQKEIDTSKYDSDIIYTDLAISYDANSGSGYIRNFANTSGSISGWNSIRANVKSDNDPNILKTDVFSSLTQQTLAYFYANSGVANSPVLNRSFFAFDTASLLGEQILSASLNFFFYHWEKNTTQNQAKAAFAATNGERTNPNNLLENDWKLANDDILSETKKYSDIITQRFTSLELNSAGIANINKNGISDFSIRDLRDIEDVYATENSNKDAAYMYSTNYSNINLRPFLEVEINQNASNIFAINSVLFNNIAKLNSVNRANIDLINSVNV